MASAMDSPAHHADELGVTQLSLAGQCNHIFCRKDISKWILAANNNCPLCRRPLILVTSTAESGASDSQRPNLTSDVDPYLLIVDRLTTGVVRDEHVEDTHQFTGMYS